MTTRVKKDRKMVTVRGRVKVQANIRPEDWGTTWFGVRSITESVLEDLKPLGAKQVNLRLNKSGDPGKHPFFIDWVAVKTVTDKLIKRSGVKDYGKYRFGDPIPSKVYEETLDKVRERLIVERDWNWNRLFREKRVESRLLVQKAGLMHQRLIGIIAEQRGTRRCVGTLTVSFKSKPGKPRDVNAKMKQWASWPKSVNSKECLKSKLVEYIEEHVVLGGPRV
jgi:hypothetical protein